MLCALVSNRHTILLKSPFHFQFREETPYPLMTTKSLAGAVRPQVFSCASAALSPLPPPAAGSPGRSAVLETDWTGFFGRAVRTGRAPHPVLQRQRGAHSARADAGGRERRVTRIPPPLQQATSRTPRKGPEHERLEGTVLISN